MRLRKAPRRVELKSAGMSATPSMEVSSTHTLDLPIGQGSYVVGGCCPDGYLCQTADNCVPPSGSPYTYGCPNSQHLCPASLSYGCCPNSMACGVNQCYSTEPVTVTTTMVITTTEDGARTTYRTTTITVETPTEPSAFPTVDSGDDDGVQAVFKYFPSAIPKVSPTSTASDDGNGKGGLSTGALAGIVAGSLAFLVIVLVAAFIIIRHLNKVVAAVSSSKVSDKSNKSNTRPPAKDFKTADSEVDQLSANPLIVPARPVNPGPDSAATSPFGLASGDLSSNDPTPGADGYHAVSGSAGTSRHASFDALGTSDDYFNVAPTGQPRFSQMSRFTGSTVNRSSTDSHGAYTHVRHWSNASEGSDGTSGVIQSPTAELEATPLVPELPSSPSSVAFPREERRRSSGSVASVATRPPMANQRLGSGQRVRSDSASQSALSIVSEEIHGFHGPRDHLVGQTATHRPGTRESNNQQDGTNEQRP
ncbi:hypothetical protein FZEAL_739 [Fusarium zealandicum]|uniref:Uncharacterized protein n=1 Tax=Fusarium zealandicum TaxID=1053134 RepID=A0A8H4XPI8_9HYPO|nr:hypothetical protein FZEAL_739 [Fusarium zealandicum]